MCHPAPDTEAPDKYTRQREAGEVAEDTQQREGEGVGRDTPRREGGEVRRAFETAGGAFFGPPAGEWGSVAFDNRGAEYRDTVVAASLPFRSPSNAKPPYVPSSTPKKPSNAHTRSGAEPAGPGGAGGGGVGEGGDGHPRESYSGGGEECGDLRFLVVTPARTAMRWVGYAVSSVRAQEHANWRMVVVDDASEDGTAEAARHAAQGDDRVTVIRNDERRGALANLLLAVDHADPADEEVVVVLDGDDWLAHPRALSLLCPAYNRHGAWVTYGTYLEFPTGLTPDWIVDFAPSVVEQKTFRQTAFVSSHLRTFKTFLLRAIPLAEFCYPVDRQDQGWGPLCPGGDTRMFDRAGADVAVMLPLLELAGHRIVRVPHVVHVYNVATPLNDFKVHLQEQWDVDSIVRGRARLERLPGARLFPAKPSVVVLSPPPNFRVKREAGGDVAIEYQVEGVWMPEEGLAAR
ncbi:nucleotide-diphospho-sugar transferase [Baffinella frigidus]|nr:nucleotide-diphospho-sugar transferase [Cryptophyta sp. CCMP2293]